MISGLSRANARSRRFVDVHAQAYLDFRELWCCLKILQGLPDSKVISKNLCESFMCFPELRVFRIHVRNGSQHSSIVELRFFNRPVPFFILLIAFSTYLTKQLAKHSRAWMLPALL